LDEKINLVVAQVDALALQNSYVSDFAENKMLTAGKDKRKFSTETLLNSNSVDFVGIIKSSKKQKLDLSVRIQLFETLKNGYLKS